MWFQTCCSCVTENLNFEPYRTQGHHQPFSKHYLGTAASCHLTVSRSPLERATTSDPTRSLLNKHPYFFPAPMIILEKQLTLPNFAVFAFISTPRFVVGQDTVQVLLESVSPGL